jgi:hypothetical protein
MRTRPGSGRVRLVDESLFLFLIELEIEKAQRLQYCVSVVFVALDPERESGGADGGGDLVRRLAEAALPHLRATDIVTARWPSMMVGLLLVDADTRTLPAIVHRLTEAWETERLLHGRRDRLVAWGAGGGCYPRTAGNVTGLIRQASELAFRARAAGGDRLYLPS